MGQYIDQLILDSYHHTVEDVMEVLLDIALTVLGTLGQGHQPGKALGRLHTPKDIALVAVDCNLGAVRVDIRLFRDAFHIVLYSLLSAMGDFLPLLAPNTT